MTDREEIQDVLTRYALGVDRQDLELLAASFTDDVHIELEGTGDIVGMRQLRAVFGGWAGLSSMPGLETFELVVSTHTIGMILFEIHDDVANTESYCTVQLVGRRGAENIALVRGIRYLDELTRGADGWKIRKRYHSVDWMYEAPASIMSTTRLER